MGLHFSLYTIIFSTTVACGEKRIEKVCNEPVDLVKVISRQNVENASCLLLAVRDQMQEERGSKKGTVQVLSRIKRKRKGARMCWLQI